MLLIFQKNWHFLCRYWVVSFTTCLMLLTHLKFLWCSSPQKPRARHSAPQGSCWNISPGFIFVFTLHIAEQPGIELCECTFWSPSPSCSACLARIWGPVDGRLCQGGEREWPCWWSCPPPPPPTSPTPTPLLSGGGAPWSEFRLLSQDIRWKTIRLSRVDSRFGI